MNATGGISVGVAKREKVHLGLFKSCQIPEVSNSRPEGAVIWKDGLSGDCATIRALARLPLMKQH